MIIKDRIWIKLMKIFSSTCHQRADRSFFLKNYQFPLCARCTGMILGYIFAIVAIIILGSISVIVSFIFMGIMFLDWFIQFKRLKESTNIRRLITGIIGGYGVVGLLFNIIKLLV